MLLDKPILFSICLYENLYFLRLSAINNWQIFESNLFNFEMFFFFSEKEICFPSSY